MAMKGITNSAAGWGDLKNRIIRVKSRQILIALDRCRFLSLNRKNHQTMTAFWHCIGDMFQAMFKIVPPVGMFFNKLLIAIGFIAFFGWMRFMSQNKSVEKFD